MATLPISWPAAPEPPAPPWTIARETLRALAAPRRLFPILVIVVPLLAEQSQSRDPASALLVGVALAAASVVLAPITWRVLAAERPTPARVLLYAALGAFMVLAIGVALPRNLDHVALLEPSPSGGYVARTRGGHRVEVSRQAARELRRALGLARGSGEEA